MRALTEPADAELIDVGLVLFDPNIPAERTEQRRLGVSPKIRRAEVLYQPFALRQTLVETGLWGAVRVLPEPDPSIELSLVGKIMQSDGGVLELAISATDSTGRLWLDKTYKDIGTDADFEAETAADQEPFQDLYNKIANDLLVARRMLNEAELKTIDKVSQLRYAANLAPETFDDHLLGPLEGRYSINRLPSDADPMLARVERIRQYEYLFIDTVDEEYDRLYREMKPTYLLWRRYNRKQTLYQDDYEKRLEERDRDGRRGSFTAMRQTYNAYKWSKVQQQEMQELALGFDNEIKPTLMEMDGRVVRLSGTLHAQYTEWREILRSMFALEIGLPPSGAGSP